MRISILAKKLVNAEIDLSVGKINKLAFDKITEEIKTERLAMVDFLLNLKNRDEEVFIKYFERFFNPYTVQDLLDGKVI